jgi:hypothetical protein
MDEEATMKVLIDPLLAIFVGACATMQAEQSGVSILVDLDPASTDRTVIVESITADREGRLYLPDRVSGNILLEFDAKGTLYVADTARGAIWKVEMQGDGKGGKPNLWAQSPLLEGADGLAFDNSGKLWVAANERNALVTVTPDGNVQQVAKNGSAGPLEFPSATVFVGNTGYISNYDVPRRDNMDANGQTARDGIGASIAQITP